MKAFWTKHKAEIICVVLGFLAGGIVATYF